MVKPYHQIRQVYTQVYIFIFQLFFLNHQQPIHLWNHFKIHTTNLFRYYRIFLLFFYLHWLLVLILIIYLLLIFLLRLLISINHTWILISNNFMRSSYILWLWYIITFNFLNLLLWRILINLISYNLLILNFFYLIYSFFFIILNC